MQNFKLLYKELAQKLSEKIPAIQWVDLWHNQVNFLKTEHPFPSPACFLQFRTINIVDVGEKVQNVQMQVDVFLFYETFADTYRGGVNEDDALSFLDNLDDIQSLFHGTSGENYSGMRRISVAPVDTGDAGNLYLVSFRCELLDYAAQDVYNNEEINSDISFEEEFKVN